jgi:uncharacterized protein
MNRLSQATSPYLLQHQTNPVDWWEWGSEAFAEAKRTNRPVLLSVGYAACHWCHLMAHESFENPEIAAVMNELFVNIKVDREERPDVDHIYMSALKLLGERGGWPLTMFLDPEGKPFWGGTYFPPEPRFGRAGFPQILRSLADIYHKEPERIRQNTGALTSHLQAQGPEKGRAGEFTPELFDRVRQQIAGAIGPVHGGLRGSPKFPNPSILEHLARYARRTGDAHATELFTLRSTAWRRVESTTTWAAASRAIRSTSAGWCRISRRCSTTTPSCSSSTPLGRCRDRPRPGAQRKA